MFVLSAADAVSPPAGRRRPGSSHRAMLSTRPAGVACHALRPAPCSPGQRGGWPGTSAPGLWIPPGGTGGQAMAGTGAWPPTLSTCMGLLADHLRWNARAGRVAPARATSRRGAGVAPRIAPPWPRPLLSSPSGGAGPPPRGRSPSPSPAACAPSPTPPPGLGAPDLDRPPGPGFNPLGARAVTAGPGRMEVRTQRRTGAGTPLL